MYLGENLQAYKQLIKDNIFYYAYENHLPKPILNNAIPSWIGEVFLTSNIDTELHLDIIEDLKTLNIYDKIKRDTDRFVILPDVFSIYPIPLKQYTDIQIARNQYDTDKKNIVIINGKLFELHRELAEYEYYYNHNGKFYYFYKNNPDMEKLFDFNKTNNTINVITIKSHGFLTDRVTSNWNMTSDEEKGYALYLNKDNKWTDDDTEERACIYINQPYIDVDYTKINTDSEEDIPGLMTIGWRDMEMRPKWYNNDFNLFFVQNPDILFSTTALVLFKDGTYHVENLYMNSKGKYVERVDKHTVKFSKDNKIRRIVMFTLPYTKPSFERPDSLYYKAILKNPMVSEYTSQYRINTTKLYEWMIQTPCLDVDELIDYGYKKDINILKVIQNTFPRVIRFNKYDVLIKQYYGHSDDNKDKFKYVYNKLWFRDVEKLCKEAFSTNNGWNMFVTRLREYSFNELIMSLKNVFDYSKHLVNKKDKINFNSSITKFRYLVEQLIALMKSYQDRINISRDFPEYPIVMDFFINLSNKTDEYFYVMNKTKIPIGIVYPQHTFHLPKIMIPVFNPLQKYPALFINNILYPIDYKIIKDHDIDILVIDPKNFWEFYVGKDISHFTDVDRSDKNTHINNYSGREEAYKGANDDIPKERNIDYLYEMWIKNVQDVKIVLADFTEMKDPNGNKHIHGRICRDPINFYALVDEFSSSTENNTIYKGEPFVNGHLSNDIFARKDVEIPLNLTVPVSAFRYGDYNMNGNKVIHDNNDIFRSLDTCFAVAKVSFKYPDLSQKRLFGLCRINLGIKQNVFADFTLLDHSGYKLQPIDKPLIRDNQVISFNQYGMEVIDDIDILSRTYVDLNDIRYNSDNIDLVTQNQCASIFTPSYKSVEYNYNLEIDYNLVSPDNKHYNDKITELNDVIELFDPVPNRARVNVPFEILPDDNILHQTLAIRYGYNERHIGSRDISSDANATIPYDNAYITSKASRGYNPLDLVFSGYRLQQMLETSNMTFIIDHTTPQLWNHNSTPPTSLNDWRTMTKSAVFIDSNAKYQYPDDAEDTTETVTKFHKIPEKTLVVKYNMDIFRRIK